MSSPTPQQTSASFTFATPVARSEWVALAMVLVAQLIWDGHAPIATKLGFPFMAVALGAWVVLHVRPGLFAKVPRWPVDHTLELVAGLLLFTAFLEADAILGFVLQVAAVAVLARALPPAPAGGRLVDVARLWRSGWTMRILFAVLVLTGLDLGSEWNGAFDLQYHYDSGDYTYYVHDHTDGSDAWAMGYGSWLGLFLAVAVIALVVVPWWRSRRGLQVAMLALALAVVRGIWLYVDDIRFVHSLQKYGDYPQFQAGGAFYYVALAVVAAALLFWFARIVQPAQSAQPPVAPTPPPVAPA